ncbi:pseudouridine synthase [Coprinopsis cinerea okayama7|uniref:Pseudouridine synthase n=1 Tax=Coprinopsis cinerea (strain Okayama-7 / 130 / ATCC MYA-4618 / FGSC 9003) TaxID=240176 RepID=A8NIQ6_COPC7|nr:pseudouridine synthase [Coprinopsis cinerea okayama7\|eukprot:XP_001834048.1 pseudouridine synthase [Coprinopsis cinerea okayama7\
MATSAYAGWTREQLLERVLELERGTSLPGGSSKPTANKEEIQVPKPLKPFDFYSYPRRKIALKFSYAGWDYGGLAYQPDDTPLPTVEGVLFDALSTAHLVDSNAGLEGCGWERCGRTDRGVSGARQIVSVWVRSALRKEELAEADIRPGPVAFPPNSRRAAMDDDDDLPERVDDEPVIVNGQDLWKPDTVEPQSRNEHDYVSILNRLLPETIRVSAWSPVPSTFSARFSCNFRHYKYFFTPKGLDIVRMQEAAGRLIGEHDFRNLCKLDPAKQITSFKRKVMSAHIERLNDNLHVFNLTGSAFLYHQVRHIMAILFLIGMGMESPSLVSNLLNVTSDSEVPRADDLPYEIVDRKPEYQMADGLPLMLWDCGYPEGTFDWRTTGKPDAGPLATGGTLYDQLDNILVRSNIYSALNEHFLLAAAQHHPPPPSIFPLSDPSQLAQRKGARDPINVHLGGGTFKRVVKYTPVLKRNRLDTVEVANERWRLGKGARKSEKKVTKEGPEPVTNPADA